MNRHGGRMRSCPLWTLRACTHHFSAHAHNSCGCVCVCVSCAQYDIAYVPNARAHAPSKADYMMITWMRRRARLPDSSCTPGISNSMDVRLVRHCHPRSETPCVHACVWYLMSCAFISHQDEITGTHLNTIAMGWFICFRRSFVRCEWLTWGYSHGCRCDAISEEVG